MSPRSGPLFPCDVRAGRLGGRRRAVTGDRDSYQYLVESIRRFPDQDSFAALIRAAGFDRVQYRNLSMGIAALHSGWKL